MTALVLMAALYAAPELHPGSPITVTLVGGERYEGLFSGLSTETITIISPEMNEPIPVALIASYEVSGELCTFSELVDGLESWSDGIEAEQIRTPSPAGVAALSGLWAGAGPLALGQRSSFVAYSVVEVVFLSSVAIMAYQGQYGQVALVGGVDVLLHVYAASDSFAEAKRRRRRENWELSGAIIVSPNGASPYVSLTVGAYPPNGGYQLHTDEHQWPGLDR